MPLTRVSLRRGKPAAYRKAVLESLYRAMRETFDVPEGDRFMTISEHDDDDFLYGADNTRPVAQKQKLYRRIAERLTESPGLCAEDIFINLVEVLPENWSFGNGEAQYVR
ncbi:tautomerase family protein [Bradyrhizobium brasilense]|uniref:Tautomerase enzyme n=1 Tax=Bradyrhizobium brasilense TaxID=1419277 RepID=A0A1G6NM71_9BRAD|nr:tautomerase family protein [Bradyrhizobium brasilense]MCC8972426.1 tautomerase family protein [Bradyrhizobium brasilense]SDC68819.1 Tautomerase enzyme [Bradyrhizobium brasilense]